MECCRLCSAKDKLLDVFDSRFQNGGEVVRTYIYLCSGVEILATDIISKKICQQCLDEILHMFKFRTKAGLNDRKQKKDAGLEVEKMKPVPAIIKNNLDMLKKISNIIIKVNGVSDIIIIDDDDSEVQSDIIAAPIEDVNPIQVNNVTDNPAEDLLGTVASTSSTTDNELATEAVDKIESKEAENNVAISDGELATASTTLLNGQSKNNNDSSNVDHSKDTESTLPSNNTEEEIGESQVDDSLLLKNNQKETELNNEVSQIQLDSTISDANKLQNDAESRLKELDNSIADVQTKSVESKLKRKSNSTSKRKSNKSSVSNEASTSKQVNISISDKSKNIDESTNKIDISICDGEKTKDFDANDKSKNGDASSTNQMEISISDAKKSNLADTNCSEQMYDSVRGGKKTKSVSKNLKGNKQDDIKYDSDQDKTIDEKTKYKNIEGLKFWIPSKSIVSVLKKYPKLIIAEDLLNLNISPTISLRRCDEKSIQRNVKKRINSPVALTRARKRLRASLPAESPFRRLEANSHINNMEEKKEMFVSSLELVSKDKIQDPASENIAESKLNSCIDCSEKFKSNNSLKIHRRRQYCKWCKECFKCSTVKYKHENFECKFKKKLVVEIEKMNDETRLPAEPPRVIDIDVEISLKEYILNKMTMTEEKIIQTEKLKIAPEQPIVEGNKIRYKDLYRDIVSSYMPVQLCLSTKNKSKIVRTNLQPQTSVKQPVTEIKKTTYEKKTQQQINDILFHTSKSPCDTKKSSSNKSAVGVVKQLVPTVVSGQQQMNTAVNSQSVNSTVVHQQFITPINNQQINSPVPRPAVNQELINSQNINEQVIKLQENQQSTAVDNKQQVNIPVIKPPANQFIALINNQQTQISAVNQQIPISNHQITISNHQIIASSFRPTVTQQQTIPVNNQIIASSFRPTVTQQQTIPINNQIINLRPVVSQHTTIPVNNLAVSQHLTNPASNSASSSVFSIQFNPTVACRQYSTCAFQCGNASKTVVNSNISNPPYLNQLQLNANLLRARTTIAPNVLNSNMAHSTNSRQNHHLSFKVSNNETPSTSTITVPTKRNMEVLNLRATRNVQNPYIISKPVQATTFGGQSSSAAVTVLQTEKGPINQQEFRWIEKKNTSPNTHIKDTHNEKNNDNPVILNGSRSVSNKIWVKNPMEINKSANM